MTTPLQLAVVGHTNTGKTSLLRTLARDPRFGEVADQPSTTRDVAGLVLQIDGAPQVALFDTPGLESASDLHDYLDQLQATQGRCDGPDQITRLLQTRVAAEYYEQECKVLRQVMQSDATLYVIDAREAVLGKYRDELAILNLCGRPILPVLNFVRQPPHRAAEWRAALARLGLHVVVEFDTVAPALDGETQLYERLGTLLDGQAATLRRLAHDREHQRRLRHDAALRVAAEVVIDVAAVRRQAPRDQLDTVVADLRDAVRRHEAAAVGELLSLFGFDPDTVSATDLPPDLPRLERDLFHPELLKELGMHVGVGVASGAVAGAAVDLFTGGLSLGMGTVVGATVGGLWQSAESLGQRVVGRVRGWQDVTVADGVVAALALRLTHLIGALERRGHAAQDHVTLMAGTDSAWHRGRLPPPLQDARGMPRWSRLDRNFEPDRRRTQAVDQLGTALDALLRHELNRA